MADNKRSIEELQRLLEESSQKLADAEEHIFQPKPQEEGEAE